QSGSRNLRGEMCTMDEEGKHNDGRNECYEALIHGFQLGCLKKPSLFLASVKFGKGGETTADRREGDWLFQVWYRFGHDSPTAIRKFVEPPKLFRSPSEVW